MSPRQDREGRESTPPRVEINPPAYPSGDYTYVLEIVMKMQDTMGQLKEAVASLKEQSKSQGEKLDKIGNDVHAAKVVLRIVGAAIVTFIAFCGWMIYEFLPILRDTLHKP